MATVTCTTPGCAKSGEPVPDLALTFTDDEGNTVAVDAVVCGVCGQNITDISDDEREGLTT